MFHQVEGMVIDKGVTMADLKGTLNTVVEQLYGKGTKTRFRPHHFPFTEPSCEMDVQCHKCGGVGPTCKGEGWIELLGAGMIHPGCWRWRASIPASTPAGPSASAWSAPPCGASKSPICG